MTLKIKRKDFFSALMFIPFLKMSSLEHVAPWLEFVFDASIIVVFLYLGLEWFKSKLKPDYLFYGLLIFWGIQIITTIVHDGEIFLCLASTFKYFAVYFFVRVVLIKWNMSFDTMIVPIEILLVLNILTWILMPGGLYREDWNTGTNYLLGMKNAYFYYMAFFILAVELKNYEYRQKHRHYERKTQKFINRTLPIILAVFNVLVISKSLTTIIGLAVMLVMQNLLEFSKNRDEKIVWFYLGVAILLNAAIWLIASRDNGGIILQFINSTEKNYTMGRRFTIWKQTIEAIPQYLYFGHGFMHSQDLVRILTSTTSHNKFLWILFRGGLFCTVLLFLSVFCSYREIKRSYKVDRKISRNMGVIMFGVTIAWLAEVYDNNMLIFGTICICCELSNLMKAKYGTDTHKNLR